VTLALWLVGGLPTVRSLLVVMAQLLGGIAAAGVVSALFPGELNVETTLGGGTSAAQGLFIEMFLTAQLILTVIMLAVVKHKGTFLAPVGIGLSIFVAQLCGRRFLGGKRLSFAIDCAHSPSAGAYFTGGSLNLARSLGPAVVNHSFPGYFWIYVVGPPLGSLLASGFFALMTQLHWQSCNPGQDADGLEAPPMILKEVDTKHFTVSETTAVSYSRQAGENLMADNNGAQIA
jgi:aquaporin rerated protein, other eukaryote